MIMGKFKQALNSIGIQVVTHTTLFEGDGVLRRETEYKRGDEILERSVLELNNIPAKNYKSLTKSLKMECGVATKTGFKKALIAIDIEVVNIDNIIKRDISKGCCGYFLERESTFKQDANTIDKTLCVTKMSISLTKKEANKLSKKLGTSIIDKEECEQEETDDSLRLDAVEFTDLSLLKKALAKSGIEFNSYLSLKDISNDDKSKLFELSLLLDARENGDDECMDDKDFIIQIDSIKNAKQIAKDLELVIG